jgi:hypothetical protein
MTSTYTANNGIEKIETGDQSGTWGETTNTNFDIIDRALNGVGSITLSGTSHTLTTTDGSLTDGMFKVLSLAGSPTGTNTITISPNDQDKLYFVKNASGQSAVFSQGTGANVTIPNGNADIIFADGAGSGAAVSSLFASSVNFGDNVTLNSDNAVLGFGADTDVTITHDPDDGLFFKSTATGDDNPFVLTIQTGETDIAANDKLGVINFQAPNEGAGSDAIEVAAGIEAVSEGDFSATANATSLVFKTASDAAATEKMRIDSTGRLNIGANSSTSVSGYGLKLEATGNVQQLLKAGANFNSAIAFADPDSSTSGEITYVHNGDRMEFDVNGGKKMEIDSKGQVAISGSSTAVDTTPSTNGLQLYFKNDVGAAVVGSASDSTLGNIIFQTSPSGGGAMLTSFTVNALQNIVMAAGKGIDFANNAHPTGMSSELFDDYEEGTFTGTLGGATSDPSSAVTATGTYTKIGRFVYAAVGFTNVNTTGASGMVQVTGWPHDSSTTMPTGNVMSQLTMQVRTDTGNIAPFWASGTIVRFYQTLHGSNVWVGVEHAAGTNRYLYVSVTYETS